MEVLFGSGHCQTITAPCPQDTKSSAVKKAQHPFALRQEVTVLKRLSGSLNVARLQVTLQWLKTLAGPSSAR